MSITTTQNNNAYLKPKYSKEKTPQEHLDTGRKTAKKEDVALANRKSQETPANESTSKQIQEQTAARKQGQQRAMLLVIHVGKG